MLSESLRRATAWAVIASVSFLLVGGANAAEPVTVFTGKVFRSADATPIGGAVVRLVGPSPEASYAAAPTGADGAFRLEGARPGSYRVLAETADGAYLAADGYELEPGTNRPVALTLGGEPANQQASAAPAAQPQKGLPTWAKWTIIGGIAILGLWAIDSVTSDEEETPSSPM